MMCVGTVDQCFGCRSDLERQKLTHLIPCKKRQGQEIKCPQTLVHYTTTTTEKGLWSPAVIQVVFKKYNIWGWVGVEGLPMSSWLPGPPDLGR